jgi:hypothetical protein
MFDCRRNQNFAIESTFDWLLHKSPLRKIKTVQLLCGSGVFEEEISMHRFAEGCLLPVPSLLWHPPFSPRLLENTVCREGNGVIQALSILDVPAVHGG